MTRRADSICVFQAITDSSTIRSCIIKYTNFPAPNRATLSPNSQVHEHYRDPGTGPPGPHHCPLKRKRNPVTQ